MQVSMEKIIIFLNQVEIQLKIAKTSAQKQNVTKTVTVLFTPYRISVSEPTTYYAYQVFSYSIPTIFYRQANLLYNV